MADLSLAQLVERAKIDNTFSQGHDWQTDGGRTCPRAEDCGASQAVYKCARCGDYDYWRTVALYLADCHAATAYDYEVKSASKTKRDRMISIMTTCIAAIGKQQNKCADHPRDPTSIIDRCHGIRTRLMELNGK